MPRFSSYPGPPAPPKVYTSDYVVVDDPTFDNTVPLQTAINSLPTNGILEGSGSTYTVTSLHLQSNMTLQNVRLVSLGGGLDDVAPIKIGADDGSSVSVNIQILNVSVDGNRVNQTGLVFDENRYGIQFIGRARNVLVCNCTVTNCATDGVTIYPGPTTPTEQSYWPLFSNIQFINSSFQWNRRCGMSAASMANVSFNNCDFSNNGRTVGGQPGITNSSGIDFEPGDGYRHYDNMKFVKCRAVNNSACGVRFYDATGDPSPNSNLSFQECVFGDSVDFFYEGALGFITPEGIGAYRYQNITITDCDLEGLLVGWHCDGLILRGGVTTGYEGVVPGVRAGWFIYSRNLNLSTDTGSLPWGMAYGVPPESSVQVGVPEAVTRTEAAGDTYDMLISAGLVVQLVLKADAGSGPSGQALDVVATLSGGTVTVTGTGAANVGSSPTAPCQVFEESSYPDPLFATWRLKNNTGVPWTVSYSFTI